jgi:adenosylcobyric acid synthase
MLGEVLEDSHSVESLEKRVAGLGLLPLRTRFERSKITAQVRARVADRSFLTASASGDEEFTGYEIHMGVVEQTAPSATPFEIVARNGRPQRVAEGAIDATGTVVGTMIHGLFENSAVRSSLLSWLRRRKGLSEPPRAGIAIPSRQAEYDRLEAAVREHIDCNLLWRISRLTAGR